MTKLITLIVVAIIRRLSTLNVNMRMRNSARFTTGLTARRSWARKPIWVTPKTSVITVVRSAPSVETLGAERTTVMTLVFGVTLIGFLAHERRAVSPVVNLALFRIRMFTFSVLSLLMIATTISVMSFLMPFYIQEVLHFSPSFMGLIFLAAPVFTICLATVSGQLTDRIGPRAPASIGVLSTMAAYGI